MELVCSLPFACTNKNILHDTDALKELHGSPEKPIPLGEKRIRKYVAWEYEEIGRVVGIYHRCFQQLFEDKTRTPKFSMDRLVVRDIKGNHHVFYFDISEPINEDGIQAKKDWEDYQAGKPIDPRRKAHFEKAIEMQRTGNRHVKF